MTSEFSRRIIGTVPLEQVRRMSGLEMLRGIADGSLPLPSMGLALDFGPTLVERGKVVFEGEPDTRFLNPLGTVHGGYAATLLDSAMGCVIHSMLEPGQGYTTIEIKVNYVRAVSREGGRVRAEGSLLSIGSRIGTADGKLTDASGRLLAHGTTTCLIFPL